MSDITRGYTFTDSKADWASEKETALRLNKMIDDAKVNLVAGTNVTINRGSSGITINSTASGGTGTVTSIDVDGGTGISVSPAGPITTSGTFVVTNTAPDRTVALTGAGTTTVTGTYPNFTVSSADAYTGTVTGVSVATANGISGTVANPTTTPAITLTLGAIVPTSVNSVTLSGASTPSLSVTGTSSISGSHSGTSSGINTGDQTITLTGDVTGSGTGSFAATIANGAVSNAKLANVATLTFKGRTTAGTGSPEDLTATQATALLNSFSPTLKGLAPASGGGTTNFLRADGSWAAPAGGGTGTVTSVSVVTANGVSGTVANPTTTPAITLSLGDISAATSKPSATGSALRSFAAREGDVFNVRDFGAVGNNSTDDYAAFLAAITAQQAASLGAVVYVPSGTYLLNTRLVISNSRPLVIIGDGQASRIAAAGAGGFLKATASASFANHEFRNLRISANVNSVGIETIGSPTTSSHEQKQLYVNNVVFDYGTSVWAKGLVVTAANNGVINDCVFRGSTSGSNGLGNGIELVGFTVNLAITNCSFFAWEYGIYCPSYQEGLFVTGCFIIQVKFGIYYASNDASILGITSLIAGYWYEIQTIGTSDFTTVGAALNSVGQVFKATSSGAGTGTASGLRSTQLIVTSTHIDARGSGSSALWAYNAANILVSGCYFISDSGTYVVYLQRCFESSFSCNMFYGSTAYGIYLANGPSSLSCIAVSIYANAFRGSTTDIYADTNAVMIRAQGNVKAPSSNTSMTVTYISSGGRTADNDIQTT